MSKQAQTSSQLAFPPLVHLALLARGELVRRWRWRSAPSFHRTERDGLLIPVRKGRLECPR